MNKTHFGGLTRPTLVTEVSSGIDAEGLRSGPDETLPEVIYGIEGQV